MFHCQRLIFGADLSLVDVGFSFTVANGLVPLQQKERNREMNTEAIKRVILYNALECSGRNNRRKRRAFQSRPPDSVIAYKPLFLNGCS